MRALLTAAICVAAACAPAVQAEPAFDPVGTYDFTTVVEGSSVPGTLTITRVQGAQTLAAQISTQLTGSFPASGVLTERTMELRASTEQGNLLMRITVADDDRITGTWSLDTGLSGTVTGARRRA